MKVSIGRYKDWIGPYQLTDKIPFLSEETKDKLGEWLAETWVNDLCLWFANRSKRKEYIRIDPYDTWNMDHTLALIILPMLKQLRDTKHGSPYVDDEDVPEAIRSTSASPKENDWDTDDYHFHRWTWVLNEMIWAFENVVDDSWELEIHKKGFDNNVYNEYNERINNGLRLFGKYYRGLWD